MADSEKQSEQPKAVQQKTILGKCDPNYHRVTHSPPKYLRRKNSPREGRVTVARSVMASACSRRYVGPCGRRAEISQRIVSLALPHPCSTSARHRDNALPRSLLTAYVRSAVNLYFSRDSERERDARSCLAIDFRGRRVVYHFRPRGALRRVIARDGAELHNLKNKRGANTVCEKNQRAKRARGAFRNPVSIVISIFLRTRSRRSREVLHAVRASRFRYVSAACFSERAFRGELLSDMCSDNCSRQTRFNSLHRSVLSLYVITSKGLCLNTSHVSNYEHAEFSYKNLELR